MATTRKRQLASEQLLQTHVNFSNSVMVSVYSSWDEMTRFSSILE